MVRGRFLFALFLAGCGPTLVKASSFAPVVVDLPMVAHKRALPVAIVMTAQSLPDPVAAKDGDRTRGEVHELRSWLGEQLKRVLSQLHQQVLVVEDESQLPHERHVQVHVLLKRLEVAYNVGWGNLTTVTWSLGIRMSDQPDYFHTSVGKVGNEITGDLTGISKSLGSAFGRLVQQIAAEYVTASAAEDEAPKPSASSPAAL
jgi:hypothetical protein